ncbi:hypothetical protein G7084_04460 [Weissella coleopterorum]|uniref:DNA topoisomerase n=1 Tax=Weissella coleopterorum TaxID=2714949 RepID=A0A6G8AZZ0_9LACO|nr:DNA topoisomerase [Weissella coleopterorum]QIL50628.1 hypothetical protein G7084_04460 [Weissella coleopterorum]
MKTVIIAEKPSQKKKIKEAYDSGNFPELGEVKFVNARGHLFELKEPEEYTDTWDRKNTDGSWKSNDQVLNALPIIPDDWNYRLKREARSKKGQSVSALFKDIQAAVKWCDQIIIATDPDSEGAAIAWKILWKIPEYQDKVIKQLEFNAQTIPDFQKAFRSLGEGKNYIPMAYQAMAREKSDWLVGMNISRLTTSVLQKQGYRDYFPVGRVQTPTVGLIVKRELEIQNFDGNENWRIILVDQPNDVKFNGKESETCFTPENGGKASAEKLLSILKQGESKVVDLKTEAKVLSAPKLYKFSKLMADASRRFKFSPGKVKKIYQKLYEDGWVSYPRTDEEKIAPSEFKYLLDNVNKFLEILEINDFHVANTIPDKRYVSEGKLDHSANIPSSQIPTVAQVNSWDMEQQKLYKMIVLHTMLMFAPKMSFDGTTVTVNNSNLLFTVKGQHIKDQGWTKWDNKTKKDKTLPDYQLGQILNLTPTMNQMNPPKRYTEIDMTDHVLDSNGLGRPSTQAMILEKVESTYLNKNSKNAELSPKPQAFVLMDFLNDTNLASPEMTAKWEEYLDKIGENKDNASQEVFVKQTEGMVNSLINDLSGKIGTFGGVKAAQDNESSKKTIKTVFGEFKYTYFEGKGKYGTYYQLKLFNISTNELEHEIGKKQMLYALNMNEDKLVKLLETGRLGKTKFETKEKKKYSVDELTLNPDFTVTKHAEWIK